MGIETIDKGYEIQEISKYLDFINLMAYDLHGAWEKFVGLNAPLFAREDEVGKQIELNVDYALRYWLGKGAPADKLVLGLGTYGRAFKLNSPTEFLPGSGSKGPGEKGTYSREAGFLTYYEICEKIETEGWEVKWDKEAMAPYAHKGSDWVGFDNEKSLEIKVNYAKRMGLGGIMFWALDLDDFTGNFCNKGKYPLINAAVNALNNESVHSVAELNEKMDNMFKGTEIEENTSLNSGEVSALCPNGSGYCELF